MSRRSTLLFPAALGISAAAHLLLLFLLPYSPARPLQAAPEPIAVRLVQAQRPATPPVPSRQKAIPATRAPVPEKAPSSVVQLEPTAPPAPKQATLPQAEPEPQPAVPENPLELAPPLTPQAAPAGASSGEASAEAPGHQPAAARSPSGSGSEASAALAAEVAATQAVLSSLRARIVEKIRYPALARANGWKGTVLLELLLDGRGALEGLAVRRSSGYAVLDRAAAGLVRSVTPVDNPLGRPLRIEVPISYELKN
jgi:protein TonB